MSEEVYSSSISFYIDKNLLSTILVTTIVAIIAFVLYFVVKRILRSFRDKGFIGRDVEETVKMATAIVLAFFVLAILMSSIFQVVEVRLGLTVLIIAVIVIVIFSARNYIENAISFLFVIRSNIVKEGEFVNIDVGDRSYGGVVSSMRSDYMILRTENGTSIYIPYSVISRSIIIKVEPRIVAKIQIQGSGLDVNKIVESVVNVLRKSSKSIEKTSISVKPIEVNENSIVLLLEAEVSRGRIAECYEEIVNVLLRELPYRVSIEFIKESPRSL